MTVDGKLTGNRAELALTRGKRSPEHVALWVEAFGEGDEALARRYAVAVATFLGDTRASGEEWATYVGKLSPRTREAYSFAVTEFFEWIARKYGRVVPPHKVLRKDAEDYANWLSNRPFSLEVEKLHDMDQELRRAVYHTVERIGPADRRSIYASLPAGLKPTYTLADLTFGLGRMVLHDLLDRTPTLDQLREQHPRAGIDQHSIPVPGPEGSLVLMEVADVFQYALPRPRGVSRSTIALRLSALSTFWDVLAQGENIPGGQAILQHNIFKGLKKRVARGLHRERKAASAARRMDPAVVPRLLAYANLATTLPEKRDKALLYFLVFTGTRLSEAISLRRGEPPASEINRWPGWFIGNTEPPVVRVRRKGGKMQSLPYPPIALRALADFQAELERRAAPSNAQSDDPKLANYIQPLSPRWRYRELAKMPDAPLFPPVHFWGANSTYNYQEFKPNPPLTYGPPTYRRSMSAAGVRKLLLRMAKKAGLSDSDVERVHPHALRHFAATAMAQGGKDLREIQAILGHESVTTTEGYLADIESVVALSGQAEILEYLSQFAEAAEAVPEPPPHVPRAPRTEVIETYAIPVPKEPEPAPTREHVRRTPQEPKRPSERELAEARAMEAAKGALPPTVTEELAAIQAAGPAYVAPEEVPGHSLATAPSNEEPEVFAPPTAEGRVTVRDHEIIAVDGEPLPEEVKAEVILDQIRDKKSPGSPEEAYEALERGDHWEVIEFTRVTRRTPKDADLVTISVSPAGQEQVQRRERGHEFLATFYDPWPKNYGIGTVSLLPWFTKGQAAGRNGRITGPDPVTGKQVEIPPLPVLAPEQVLPEHGASSILDGLEDLYTLWVNGDPSQGIAPSPTRTFGLVRWYGFFAYTTGALRAYLRDKKKEYDRASRSAMGLPVPNLPKWVPFNALATVGEEVRVHKDEWVLQWFKVNAHTFITTRDFYKRAIGRRREEDRPGEEAFARAFEAVHAQSLVLPSSLPDWFAEDDPVHALYRDNPEEWERFATWLASVTGQKLGKQRREARADAADYAEKSWEERREEASELLREYWTEIIDPLKYVSMYLRGERPLLPLRYKNIEEDPREQLREQKRTLELMREEWVRRLGKLGLPDPHAAREVQEDETAEEAETSELVAKAKREHKAPVLLPRDRSKRIAALLDTYLPRPTEERDTNVLRASALFDARLLNIDYNTHTIGHPTEYREEFARQYDGRDSELVMRRAARAMWEYAKTHGEVEKPPEGHKGYEALYSVMLCYIAWIVPGPEAMEREAVASGRVRVAGPEARRAYIRTQAELLYSMAYGRIGATTEQVRALATRRKKLLESGTPTEQVERLLTDELVQQLMTEHHATEREVRDALNRFDATQTSTEVNLEDPLLAADLRAQMGAEGYMRETRVREEVEQERQKRRRAARGQRLPAPPVVEAATVVREGERVVAPGIVKRRGTMKANEGARVTFEYLTTEERIDAWYRVTCDYAPPEHGKKYAPNRGAVRYVSPAAMARKYALTANARRVLPSPFRIIAAMNLQD